MFMPFKKLTFIIILLLIFVVSLLGVFSLRSHSNLKLLQDSLSQKTLKIQKDSILLEDYKGIQETIFRSMSAGEQLDFPALIGKDSIGIVINILLNKQINMSNLLEKKVIILDNKTRFLLNENQQYYNEREEAIEMITSLKSIIDKKNILHDSLLNELLKVKDILLNTRLDSTTLISPKGEALYFYGKITNNQPEGFGIGFYEGKGYYIGEWKENLRNGKGKHFYKNGDIYKGDFKNDLREGYGIYYFASGGAYKGAWKNNLMDGSGEIISREGDTLRGVWENGEKAEQKKLN